jgi:DegV family protein with EDD domain
MRIAISVETTCDMPKELLEQYDIKSIPFTIVLGDKMIKDGELTTEQIFEFVDNNGILPKTTAINEFEYSEFFESLKKDYDAVVHISLSSGISSTCSNAIRASGNMSDVFVVDSKSLSTGISLLAIYARELADQGETPKDIFAKVTEKVKSVQTSFVVERLDYLYKGGRCNSVQLLGANILKIRPRIALNEEGKMGMDKKYRGSMGGVIAKYCQEILAERNNPDLKRVFITYTTATQEMLDSARSACRGAGFKEIFESRAGGTIASHCGGNTLGILYLENNN